MTDNSVHAINQSDNCENNEKLNYLKPCPFCGSAPVIMTRPFYRWRLYYAKCGQIQKNGSKGCLNAWLNIRYDTTFSREKAIRSWNRQVDMITKIMNRQSKNQWVEEDDQEGEE